MTSANPVVLAVVGAIIGACVGLTGVGGGALMTPALLLLGVDPLTAVASDLVVSLVMKPIGASVHLRRGTVNKRVVTWLMFGSIPTAFVGAAVVEKLGAANDVAPVLKRAIGGALLLAVVSMLARRWAATRPQRTPGRSTKKIPTMNLDRGEKQPLQVFEAVATRRGPTIALGVVGGLVVGLTSVGSGSLMIVGLLLLYPAMDQRSLVGTDLAQAIPLVGAAALGHAMFGSVSLGLALPLIAGAVPAVYLGSRFSSGSNLEWARSVLVVLLAASGVQLLGVPSRVSVAVAASVASVFALLRLKRSRRRDHNREIVQGVAPGATV